MTESSFNTTCIHGYIYRHRCYCTDKGHHGSRWQGRQCDEKPAEPRCDTRGGAVVDGNCRCRAGFSGEDCSIRCRRMAHSWIPNCPNLWDRLHRSSREQIAEIDQEVGRLPASASGARVALCDALAKESGILCKEPARIAYFLMIHDTRHEGNDSKAATQEESSGLSLLQWILDVIHHPDNTYLIHIDLHAPFAFYAEVISFLSNPRFKNVFVMESREVIWSAASLVEITVDAIEELLRLDPTWDHFINLSGADFPLTSQDTLRDYLSQRRGYSMLWANYFDAIASNLYQKHISSTYSVCWERKRVNRFLYKKSRTTWFVPVKGQFWMTLSREFCNYIFFDRDKSQTLQDYLALSQVPDEKFFPTLLLNSPLRHTWIRVMDRYIRWQPQANHPDVLKAPDDFDLLISKNEGHFFFARKVTASKSAKLIARLLVHIDEGTLRRKLLEDIEQRHDEL